MSIALFLVFHKIFSKQKHIRISSHRFQHQSSDQHDFTFDKRIEDAFRCAQIAIGRHQEFKFELRLINMCIRSSLDTIDHKAIVHVLRSRGLLGEYFFLISMLYGSQRVSVKRNADFLVQRRMKQHDIVNAIMFKCV